MYYPLEYSAPKRQQHLGGGPVRGRCLPWRPALALLVTLVVVLGAVGCDSPPSSLDLPTAQETGGTQAVATAPATAAPTEAPAAAKEIVKTLGHGDTFRKSTPAPDSRNTTSSPAPAPPSTVIPAPPPSPTPTPESFEMRSTGIWGFARLVSAGSGRALPSSDGAETARP